MVASQRREKRNESIRISLLRIRDRPTVWIVIMYRDCLSMGTTRLTWTDVCLRRNIREINEYEIDHSCSLGISRADRPFNLRRNDLEIEVASTRRPGAHLITIRPVRD